MDRRLIKLAARGNLDDFLKLMKEDPLLLDNVALTVAETPLHVASMCGHLHFVMKVLELKMQFAYELNQDGFTPLHLASANGHHEIVSELLHKDHNLCTIRGKDGSIPLHCAVFKGRIHVIKELLAVNPNSVEFKNVRGETVLHLAVKSNQIEGFRFLLEHVSQLQKVNLLNEKDSQGNTVLHLAASRKQYEVVNLLLHDDSVTKGTVEVNSLNEAGLTPLDVLLLFGSEAGDFEIVRTLLAAGSKRSKDMSTSDPTQTSVHNNNQVPLANTTTEQSVEHGEETHEFQEGEWYKFFQYKKGRDNPSDVRSAWLTIAVLIFTATYQAALSPPGGLWQDNKSDVTPEQKAGESILATNNQGQFFLFMLGNSVGFYTSYYAMRILTAGFPMKLDLNVAMLVMIFSYCTSMYIIIPSSPLSIVFLVISLALPLGLAFFFEGLRSLYYRRGRLGHATP